MRWRRRGCGWLISSLLLLQGCRYGNQPFIPPVPVGQWDGLDVTAETLGVIVNQQDPLSLEIAEYYQTQRRIPDANMIPVSFTPNQTMLSVEEFEQIKQTVDRLTPATVQAYALTWAAPYRVGCMSITAAFTFGVDERFCSQGCNPTQPSPYFNHPTQHPYHDLRIRPTMALAATSFATAKALIDRGIAADGTAPLGTAYLLSTSDQARNVRSNVYLDVWTQIGPHFKVEMLQADSLKGEPDVMFYFTGKARVADIETNTFLPGAMADHLTSFGGKLTNSSQMSSLRWLEAGATGSYGTVVEPCNFPQKFPHPGVAMAHYLSGETLVEAYWKSVLWPGQGIFIGEPLAQPFQADGP